MYHYRADLILPDNHLTLSCPVAAKYDLSNINILSLKILLGDLRWIFIRTIPVYLEILILFCLSNTVGKYNYLNTRHIKVIAHFQVN